MGVGAGGGGAVITELDRAGQDRRAGTGPGPAASAAVRQHFSAPSPPPTSPHPRAAPTHSPRAQSSLCWLLGGGGQTRDPGGECEEIEGAGHEALQRWLGIKRVCDHFALNNAPRSALGKGRGPGGCFWSRGRAGKGRGNTGIQAEK